MTDKILQTEETFRNLLSRVECHIFEEPFEFVIRERNGDFALQIQFDAEDNEADPLDCGIGEMTRQYCRLWPLQVTMTDTEVIRTAYKAAQAAAGHELDEKFKFDGIDVYNPHTNIHRLASLQKESGIHDVRVPEDTPTFVRASEPALKYEYFIPVSSSEELDRFVEICASKDYTVHRDRGGWRENHIPNVRPGLEFKVPAEATEFLTEYSPDATIEVRSKR